MSEIVIERRRSGWDVIFGILLIIASFAIFGNVAIATVVSVKFLGWVILIAGLIELVGSLFQIKQGHFWGAALGGALLFVLGLVILRNTTAAAFTLTLVAGAIFLVGGIARMMAAKDYAEMRWVLLLSGAISTLLGLIVLLNLADATYKLLGILLGVQALLEGLTLLVAGRVHVDVTD